MQIRAYLDGTFPGRWIGRDSPMPWPPRSPDITPLDFFLWGYVKSNVFRTPVNGLDDLKTRIRNAISAIPADVLRATKGAHIEVY
jgi:hypothetical protein